MYAQENDTDVADVAVVAHQDHLRGVATAMLRHLAEAARRSGIRYFVVDVLTENHAMNKVVRDAGWPSEWISATLFCIFASTWLTSVDGRPRAGPCTRRDRAPGPPTPAGRQVPPSAAEKPRGAHHVSVSAARQ